MSTLKSRFEAKVDRSGEHHRWVGAKTAQGYGTLKVAGRIATAQRVAWELAHGSLPPGARVNGCPDDKACVRLEHLSVTGTDAKQRGRPRARKGNGSRRKLKDGVWQLTAPAGQYADGRQRRVFKTVHVDSDEEAELEQIKLVAEVSDARLPASQSDRDMLVADAVALYLRFLVEEKGRAPHTVDNYRSVHERWFVEAIGHKRVIDITEEDMDRVFGQMCRAGLSASRMGDAGNLYRAFFRWARRRGFTRRNPMAEFEMPISKQIPQERIPPEAHQLCAYLAAAVEHVPDIAPLLTLDAVTGMRRGELVLVRRCKLFADKGVLRVLSTKVRKERDVAIDRATVAMLQRHMHQMDERAATLGATIAPDAYMFSIEPDCSVPMSTEFLSRRVSVLKEHLGIHVKRPETVEREDKALALFRGETAPRPAGIPGPKPKGAMSFKDIGARLGRSSHWAQKAVRSASRREVAPIPDPDEFFDGSIGALRKFTSSELLNAGFNISMVANRQGHGPLVLAKHYSKGRRSAQRDAADYLGQIVHGQAS